MKWKYFNKVTSGFDVKLFKVANLKVWYNGWVERGGAIREEELPSLICIAIMGTNSTLYDKTVLVTPVSLQDIMFSIRIAHH